MLRRFSLLNLLFALSAPAQPQFVDRAGPLGVDHLWGLHVFGGDLGGGVALFDVDGDFDLDLILASQAPATLIAYRNDGSSFVDVTETWGLSQLSQVKQILFADFDDDGRSELFLSRWKQPSMLWSWNGSAFEDRSAGSGLTETISAARPGLATGASAGDLDHDGDLDLYLSYWKEGPGGPEAANRFYRNRGGLQFDEEAAALGLDSQRKSYQPALVDLSGDGWPDLLVAHDKGGGLNYWQNDGQGVLVDRTTASGLVGRESNSGTLIDGMGVTIADYDGDLQLDVYVTNVFTGNVLYRNRGDGSWVERAIPTGTLMLQTGWGTTFLDADLDGWIDLAVGNFGYGDELFINSGNGDFSASASGDLAAVHSTFGFAAGDLDGDGDLDLVRSCLNSKTALLINESVERGHWAQIRLWGTAGNRDGVGARLTVRAEGRAQLRERVAGDSYLSFGQADPHFGLGTSERFDLTIDWPSGVRDEYLDVEADRIWVAREGDALLTPEQLLPTPPSPRLRIGGNPLRAASGSFAEFRIDGLTDGTPIEIQLFDPRGRILLTRRFRHESSGEFLWQWDAGDRDHDRLASGVYRVRVRAGDAQLTGTITILR